MTAELKSNINGVLHAESFFLRLGADTLHLKRIYKNPKGIPVFMLHGSVSSGSIFYSKSLKGLAPFLAMHGCDVYIADLRGRGSSTPSVGRGSKNTQNQALTEEIPAFLNYIKQIRRDMQIHAIAHSWGGVMLLAYLARTPEAKFASMVTLGSKRSVAWKNKNRFLPLDLGWTVLGELLTKMYGYLPAKMANMGSDDESTPLYKGTRQWVYSRKNWLDSEDKFNYLQALKTAQNIPDTLYFAGQNDLFLGHVDDVKYLMSEVNHSKDKFILLSKENCCELDYDHIEMCTSPLGVKDHYPLIVKWIKNHTAHQAPFHVNLIERSVEDVSEAVALTENADIQPDVAVDVNTVTGSKPI